MGCFIACFGASTHRKSKKSPTSRRNQKKNKLLRGTEMCESAQHAKPTEAPKIHDSVKPISKSSENKEEQFYTSNEKNIMFNLINGFNEDIKNTPKVANCTLECEEKDSSRNEVEMEQVQEAKEENRCQRQTISDSCNFSSMISYPPMHRYHNCTSSDDDHPDSDLCDTGNNDGGDVMIQEESSGSLFSLSIESREQFKRAEVDDKEVTSPLKAHGSSENEMKRMINLDKETRRAAFNEVSKVIRLQKSIDSPERETISIGWNPNHWDRTQYAGSVLNPVENLTQWKAAKARTTTYLCSDEKENVILDQELNTIPIIPKHEKPSFKKFFHPSKKNADPLQTVDNDIQVDTSLSSWLAESKKTHLRKESPSSVGNYSIERENSWTSFDDRRISGTPIVEDIKQVSPSSSPRRSPNRNPDEMPLIGTIGSYWRHTGQATDSSNSGSSFKGRPSRCRKFSQDKGAADLSFYIPLDTRLERAIDIAYCAGEGP